MIVDCPDQLKQWMIGVLEPLCDAEPVKLAKYVLALINKDLPEEQLRGSMVEKLDVFLNDHTAQFVDTVFTALHKKSYKQRTAPSTAIDSTTCDVADVAATSSANTRKRAPRASPDSTTASDAGDRLMGDGVGAGESQRRRGRHHQHQQQQQQQVVPLLQSGRLRRPWNDRRRRSPPLRRIRRPRSRSPPPRARSRSPQWNKSRSPARARSRSPLDGRSRSPGQGGVRSPLRPRSRSPLRTRSRSPVRTRSRSPVRARSRSPVRARSRSPVRCASRNVRQKVGSGSANANRNRSPLLGHSPNSLRKKSTSPARSGRPAITAVDKSSDKPAANGVTDLRNKLKNNSANAAPKQRCTDFDEKGYCMRGDQCPYDHGLDPVVLKDVTLPDVLHYGHVPTSTTSSPPTAASASAHHPPPAPTVLAPGLLPFNPLLHPPGLHSAGAAEGYNPDSPSLTPAFGGSMMPIAPLYAANRSRGDSVINVPLMNTTVPPPPLPPPSNKRVIWTGEAGKRPFFDYNRVGNRSGTSRPVSLANCCLELRKVPTGLNQISHLNQHFSKFGTITNLQVCYNGDPMAALLTFSKPAEAKAAYKSTEAVLGNRFIKVFWHNKERAEQQLIESGVEDGQQKNTATHDNGEEGGRSAVIATSHREPSSRDKQADIDAIQRSQQMLAAKLTLRAATKEKQKEAQKLSVNLQKRKQELLDKQLSQQRALLARLDNKSLSKSERHTLLSTVRALQEAIVATQVAAKDAITTAGQTNTAGAATTGVPAAASSTLKLSKQQTEKQMLDMEMELYQRQQSGADTAQLSRRVAELKSQLRCLSRPPVPGTARGGSRRLRGRGATTAVYRQMTSVDRRPTRFIVSGFAPDEKLTLRTNLTRFGEVSDVAAGGGADQLMVTASTRQQAEAALARAQKTLDPSLKFRWYNGGVSSVSAESAADGNSRDSQLSGHGARDVGGERGGDVTTESSDRLIGEEETETLADVADDAGENDVLTSEVIDELEDDVDEERYWRR